MTPRPFSIRIFLPDGNADGVKIIAKSNWSGRGMVLPRVSFPDVKKRDEFKDPGVYVLVGPSVDGDLPTIYIGEADPICRRLEQHYSKKDFWTWAVFFTSKDGSLNKAHIQHLEARLVQLAQDAKKANLDNLNNPQLPALSEAERADAESYLADMLSIFPLLGLTVFEKPKAVKSKKNLLRVEAKGIVAQGYESTQGFVVMQDSQAVRDEVPSIHRYMSVLRKELIEKGVLVDTEKSYTFTQDYEFNSPSTAAGIVLGRSANGRIEWKDSKGVTLKALQEQEAAE
jgi:hypothetical protein